MMASTIIGSVLIVLGLLGSAPVVWAIGAAILCGALCLSDLIKQLQKNAGVTERQLKSLNLSNTYLEILAQNLTPGRESAQPVGPAPSGVVEPPIPEREYPGWKKVHGQWQREEAST